VSEHVLDALLKEVRACRVCEAVLPLGPRPILRASPTARILLVGQAPGQYSLAAGFVGEAVLTFLFLVVILGTTAKNGAGAHAGLAIGLTLTLIHLVGIPLTNLSVNPARSTGPALFVGGWAIEQLWLFWVAPFVGAAAAGGLSKFLFED
jgi:aquaporin Z